jgi:SAM-dependent methyltransferase
MGLSIKNVLVTPILFDIYQSLVGSPRCHARVISEMLRPVPGERILDVGCGVGACVPLLPKDISYVGIDISAPYIEAARAKYSKWGTFICGDVGSVDWKSIGRFDRAFSFGVLHHLSDAIAVRAVDLVRAVVRPGGKFVTLDPCYVPSQSGIAKFLIDHDRGEYVRDQAGFERLVSRVGNVQSRVFHDLLRIPYTQVVMEVTLGS